jgi:hypothetical protein
MPIINHKGDLLLNCTLCLIFGELLKLELRSTARSVSLMTADNEPASYILRIQRDDLERQLYSQRIFYVSIKRDWLRNTNLLFIKKAAFIGSGIIDRFISLSGLREDEKKICLENNYYGKIELAKLMRFYPALAIEDTPIGGQNLLALHGASMPRSDALHIERLVRSRLIIL